MHNNSVYHFHYFTLKNHPLSSLTQHDTTHQFICQDQLCMFVDRIFWMKMELPKTTSYIIVMPPTKALTLMT